MSTTAEPVTTGYAQTDSNFLPGGTTITYWPTYATEAQVQALESENKKLRARMKRLEKLVAAALIRVEDDE